MKQAHKQVNLQQIQEFQLFQKIAPTNLDKLLLKFRTCELEAGELLLSPLNRNQYLYLLIEGQLCVYLGSLDNQAISTLKAGDCTGELSFIDNEYPSAYVVAECPCTVLCLHRESLVALFQQSPQLMQNLMKLLCKRVRQGNLLILDSEQNANVDTLTNCFNRRWLENVFNRLVFNDKPLSALMLDVDHFKSYNDQHGHLAGDYALRLVAHTLINQLRANDSPVRFGGEEFVILLPDIAAQEARSIGERLRVTLEQIESFHSPVGVLPGVTVSIGLAQMQHQDDLQSLIARADAALYQAKQQGRNCLYG